MTSAVLEISRSAFRENVRVVQERLGDSALMLVMKDDAYGLGIDWAVDEAQREGVRWFGGYDVATSLLIRRHTAERVFAWATSTSDEVRSALHADVDLGIGSFAYLRDVIAVAEAERITARIHLKIDTGLHRNGFRPEEWDEAIALARDAEQRGLVRIAGVWSHLAEASDAEDDEARAAFLDAVTRLEATGSRPEVLHLTASAASWWRPELRGSLSRIGAFCYGVRSADGPGLDGLALVARLVAPVVEVDEEGVHIAVGAFHGLPSTLVDVTVATPAGPRRIRRIGPATTLVEGWREAAVGDRVVVFGAGRDGEGDATALAEHIGTVGEEILTRLTAAIERRVQD